ncbi:putative ABC transport system permease protein [Rhodoferax ferrireducens]|uniref:ABC transport system permease protein n=1 Tax=Rhodoferax ferrireducens TaxID=192843 RepID=A0ABU2C8Y6_9BURK|nr:FtsX-like permease family protein [Rhodoferax ferrireducens]MDR7377798.1 putative ABC transport system permease protein [Rhodoferax ferrireducens]
MIAAMQDRRAPRTPTRSAVRSLLASFSWQELVHHPWRNAAAVVAVMLGVALAFSVHLINASALSEFSSAVSAAGGQPDLELRATQGQFDEAIYARIAAHPDVALASPVLELSTLVTGQDGRRQLLKLLGVDALVVAAVAPGLMPVPDQNAERLALLAPDTLFLNPAAQQLLASPVQLQNGLRLRVAGSVGATGPPLAVMDIGAAQQAFGRLGQLSRIDLRLRSGVDRTAFVQALDLPPGITAAEPGDAAQRISNLSRAYRVNLTVLALVALFTGAFLVFSVLSLSVAKRAQQFALLGVLGLTGRERLQLVLWESWVLGSIGSLAGIALGTGLAALALRLLGGDLGGGYFAGVAPRLQWDGLAAVVYGALGVAAALVGGWWPARAAQRLPPAQTLKGLGADLGRGHRHGLSLALVLLGVLLALAPPVFGIPLGAYLSVALLLVGGITALPWLIAALYDRLAPLLAHRLLPMLAIERARRVRQSAAVAVSGVVASLSLAVALTVMVASFRDSMVQWLDVVLPADLYVRTATASAGNDAQTLPPSLVQAVAQLPGVQRVATQRTRALLLDPGKPSVTLIARQIGDPARSLPLVGTALPVPPGQIAIYVSEPMVDLYGAKPGTTFTPLLKTFEALPQAAPAPPATFFVAGVWRDYARQFGAISLEQADFVRLTGDTSVNDLALWLGSGAREDQVQRAIRALSDAPLEFSSVSQIRATSLKIFDRSFAVTYWLQAVAIAIGLFGVAASFSAQVLARRKEFGLLAHLGLTQRQILAVVAGEGAAWTLIGSVAGLALGLAVSMVLVFVVNPQSFHWTMDLHLPWPRLLALCAAVVLAGTVTAWLAGRAAAGHDAVLAVKEDW